MLGKRDVLIEKIAELDMQHDNQDISEEVYTSERMKLKNDLKKILEDLTIT